MNAIHRPRRRLLSPRCKPLWIGAVLFSLVAGCGPADPSRPQLYQTSGSLMINGSPAEGAMLVLHPVEGADQDPAGARPTAMVDASGRFELTTYQEDDGAPAGDYQIAILWFDNPDSASPWDRLVGRYAHPQTSGIEISVAPEQSELSPIRLDGVSIVRRPATRDAGDYDQLD